MTKFSEKLSPERPDEILAYAEEPAKRIVMIRGDVHPNEAIASVAMVLASAYLLKNSGVISREGFMAAAAKCWDHAIEHDKAAGTVQ